MASSEVGSTTYGSHGVSKKDDTGKKNLPIVVTWEIHQFRRISVLLVEVRAESHNRGWQSPYESVQHEY